MRVLQLGPFAPPHGGVQANLAAIRYALLERGFSCPVITLTRSKYASTDDSEIYRPQNAIQLVKHLFRTRCDIAHLHLGGNLTFRLLCLTFLCALIPRRKFVLTFHSGGYASSTAGRSAHPFTLRGFVFRKVDKIIGVNQEIIELFRKFGVESAKLQLIPPYALTGPSSETEVPQALSDFLRSHNPVILSVGLLEHEYNLQMQIDVLGPVRETFPNAGLIIIGSGSQEKNLRNSIGEKSYAKDIMLCGDIEHASTIRVISESDLMLRTTIYDGDAISVREALHLGTPVIATDNGMRPNGVHLIPAANLEELHKAIKKQLNEPEQGISKVDDGNENILAVLKVYQELLNLK